jgi:hypothetical protein
MRYQFNLQTQVRGARSVVGTAGGEEAIPPANAAGG